MEEAKLRKWSEDKTKVSRILVSIGQDFAQLGQLIADRHRHTPSEQYNGTFGSNVYKKKPKRDANAPKKNITSYLHFSNKNRQRLMSAHPDLPQTEIARLLGTEWRALSEEEKEAKIADKDKERYESEMTDYVSRNAPATPAPTHPAPIAPAPATPVPVTPSSPESPPAADAIRPKKKAKKTKH